MKSALWSAKLRLIEEIWFSSRGELDWNSAVEDPRSDRVSEFADGIAFAHVAE